MTRFKLFLLIVSQLSCLSFGLTIIAAITPDLDITNWWLRVACGWAGLMLILFGLQAREIGLQAQENIGRATPPEDHSPEAR